MGSNWPLTLSLCTSCRDRGRGYLIVSVSCQSAASLSRFLFHSACLFIAVWKLLSVFSTSQKKLLDDETESCSLLIRSAIEVVNETKPVHAHSQSLTHSLSHTSKNLQNHIRTVLFFLAGKQLSSQWNQVSSVICNMPKSILCSVSPDGPRAARCNKRTEGVHWLNCRPVKEEKKKKKEWGQITVEVPLLSTRAKTLPSDTFFWKIPRNRILASVFLLLDLRETNVFVFFCAWSECMSAVKSIHSVNTDSLNASQSSLKGIRKQAILFFIFLSLSLCLQTGLVHFAGCECLRGPQGRRGHAQRWQIGTRSEKAGEKSNPAASLLLCGHGYTKPSSSLDNSSPGWMLIPQRCLLMCVQLRSEL